MRQFVKCSKACTDLEDFKTYESEGCHMLGYTKTTTKSVEQAVEDLGTAVESNGFKVLNQLDISGILNGKGFDCEPTRILEVCHAPSAAAVLDANVNISLLLPCKINVYARQGQTYVSALDPGMMKQFFEEPEILKIADDVQTAIKRIVDQAV